MAKKTTGILEKIRRGEVNPLKGTFTTTAQAKKNKQLDDLQKTVNIAAASKNPKAGPKTKEETFSFRNQAAEALANKKPNAKPKSSTPKRKKQSVASSITDAKIKKLDTSIKGENIKAKKERSLSESDKQKLAKLEKMKDRADKKQSRKNKSIERLAFRMGDKATFQDAAALKQKRSEARKQYLRNFASQLARGEQAAPIRGFGETDDAPTNNSTLSGASAEVAAKKAQQESDTRDIFSSFSSIGNDNSDLLSNDIQSLGSFESEDSSPITYMKQEYRKKRGY